jgi:hypothetical protein
METLRKIIARFSDRTALPAWLILLSAFSMAFSGNNPPEWVTICHTPPGNPGNCHEITISINALSAHLAHGDAMVCHHEEEYANYVEMAGADKVLIDY